MSQNLNIQPNLLEQAEEDALHKNRPLAVELRTFQRLSKKVLSENSPARFTDYGIPTPSPEPNEKAGSGSVRVGKSTPQENRQWLEEVRLEAETYRFFIIRIQLLLESNGRDRERYDAQRSSVVHKMDAVQESMAELRIELERVRQTMLLRQEYDKLAEEITRKGALLPRDEQEAKLKALRADIVELQREKEQYAHTWAERRSQLKRIVEEGETMLSLIRDETKEAERKEAFMARSSVPPDGPAEDRMEAGGGTDECGEGGEGGESDGTGKAVPTIEVDAPPGDTTMVDVDDSSGRAGGTATPPERLSRASSRSRVGSSTTPDPVGGGGGGLRVSRPRPGRSPSPLSHSDTPSAIRSGGAGPDDSDEDGEIVEGDQPMEDV